MNTRRIPALALAGLLAIGGTAFAAKQENNTEAAAMRDAKVSLSQAIGTAEQQTGGHAYDAGVHVKGGRTRIAVETEGPRGIVTVTVDAQSGAVIGTHAGGEPD